MAKTIGAKMVKTRVSHDCFGCGRNFPPVSMMERSCVVDGGKAFTCYLCQTCTDIAQNLCYDDEFGFGDLLSNVLAIEREKKDG